MDKRWPILLLLLELGATPARAGEVLGVPALLRDAVETHPLVASRRQDLVAAEQIVGAAKLQFFPSPSVTSERQAGHQATTFRLSQTLWDGGKLAADLDGARLRAARSGLEVSEVQFGLALRMAELYQAWLAQAGRRDAQQRGVRKLEELAGMIERRSQSGVSAAIDVELVQARLAQARGELLAIEAAEQTALAQLARTRGRPVNREALVREQPAALDGDFDSLLARTLRDNPSMQRAAVDARIARNEAKQVGASRYPTLSLRAEHQVNKLPGAGAPGDRLLWSVNYAPGAGLASHAQTAAAVSHAEAADLSIEGARRDIADRAEVAWLELQSARARLPGLASTSRSSNEVLESSQRLFTTGRRSWLDLLNAAREQMQAEQAESDATAAAVGARYRLRLLAGEPVWLNQGAKP